MRRRNWAVLAASLLLLSGAARAETPDPAPPPTDSSLMPSRAVGDTHNCAAFFPEVSRNLDETGDVLVRYDVGADGAISNAAVVKTSGFERLDQAALACVTTAWRNTPATKDGAPVATPGHMAIVRFSITEPKTSLEFFERGVVRSARGDNKAALIDMTTAIQMSPNEPAFYLFRAGVYDMLGQRTAANADRAKAKKLTWPH